MKASKFKTESRAISNLKNYEKNSRTHSNKQIKQIAESIQEFGFTNPIIVDEEGIIVAGHGRLEAAKKLGMIEVPVVEVTGWSEAQKKAYVIADNKLALNAGWDEVLLKAELNELVSLDFDVSLTGFEPKELEKLEVDDTKVGLIDEDEVPEFEEGHACRPGDIFALGKHKLMCGSATEIEDVRKLMDNKLADIVWTDPPYNVAIEGKAGKIENDDMTNEKFQEFLASSFKCFIESIKEGGCIYVAHADSERVNFTHQFVQAGFKLSQVLIWVKQTATLSRQDYNWQHEPILYGWKEGKGHFYNGNFTKTTVIDDKLDVEAMKKADLVQLAKELLENQKSTVIRENRPVKSDLHPTMKPIKIIRDHLRSSSIRGDVVLDLFGGSGSTLIAADTIGRYARIMELDPKFCDVIINRWQEFSGEKATRADGVLFDDLLEN